MESKHISERFNDELAHLRSQVLSMGGLVESQIKNACTALVDGDVAGAREVVAKDVEVNSYEVAIDEQCTQIIAKRQPAASDLRLVTSIIKVITDLERMGDEAKRIARMTLSLDGSERPSNSFVEIRHLGQHVQTMLHDCLDALARTDVEQAVAVVAEDKAVDQEYEAIVRQLMTVLMEDQRSVKRVINTLWSVRALERIGDHAKNICEYVIYQAKGKDVRHISTEQMQRLIQTKS